MGGGRSIRRIVASAWALGAVGFLVLLAALYGMPPEPRVEVVGVESIAASGKASGRPAGEISGAIVPVAPLPIPIAGARDAAPSEPIGAHSPPPLRPLDAVSSVEGGVAPGATPAVAPSRAPALPRVQSSIPTTLEGWVEDEDSGRVEHARVELLVERTRGGASSWEPAGLAIVTSSDGTFTLRDAPAVGGLQAPPGDGRSGSLVVPYGPASSSIRLRVARKSALVGRVFGPDGQPTPGIEVHATGESESKSVAAWTGSALTDDTGNFTVFAPPGVRVADLEVPTPAAVPTRTLDWVGVRVKVPASWSPGFRLDLPRPAWIDGWVRADDGTRLDAFVVATAPDGFRRATTRAASDGYFKLGPLEPGAWRLTAQADGQTSRNASGRTLDTSPEKTFEAPASAVQLTCPSAVVSGGHSGG